MTASETIARFAPLSTHNVTLPDHLIVRTTKGNIIADDRPYGYDGHIFFGTAFIQGNRLQFTTAMPMQTMIRISKIDQAKAGSGVSEVMKRANRPKIPAHAHGVIPQ